MADVKARAKKVAAAAAAQAASAGKYAQKHPERVLQGAAALYSFGHAVMHSPVSAISMASVAVSRLMGDEPSDGARERSAAYIQGLVEKSGFGWVKNVAQSMPPIKVEVVNNDGSKKAT